MVQIPLSQYWELLARYLRPRWAGVSTLAALLFGGIALQLVNPQILRAFIDAATSGGTGQNLPVMALLFIGVALVQQALTVGATYVGERLGWSTTNALRADLTLHCLRLDLSFHKLRSPGELIERIDGDVTALANFFSQFVIQLVGNVVLLIGILVVLWVEEWRAALPLTVFAVLVLGSMLRVREIAVPYWTAARQASAQLFGFIEEMLAGTEDVRSSGAAPYVMRRLYAYTRERLRAGSKARVMGSIPWSLPIVFFAAGYAISFVVVTNLFAAGSITLGTAFLIFYYTQMLFQPLMRISNQAEEFQRASAGIVRIRELLETRGTMEDGDGADFPPGALSVECRNVTFGYGKDEPVVHEITFRIEPGEIMGLLGRTGSGKTTLARLITRLYDPADGAILLGGVDLRSAGRADLRQRIGMVTQDVHLFGATVRDNLTLFDPGIDDSEILAALDGLGLTQWCDSLPNGLDTMLQPGGGLSAGEAQLLAFTRVFLKDPGLVILDEASSRLDPVTERLIERAVERLLHGRTGLIIAHRLATLQRADAIVILDGGRIREQGRREALVGDPRSRFSELLRTGLEEVLV